MIRFTFTNSRDIRNRIFMYEDMRRSDPLSLELMFAAMRARK